MKINTVQKNSFKNHIDSIINQYLEGAAEKKVKVDPDLEEYLTGIVQSIRINNELFFKENKKISFVFLESNIPFYFSSPGGKIVISSGLIKKYIKTEELFAAILAQELIRIEKGLYRARRIIPVGVSEIGNVLGFCKLNPEDLLDLYKWSFLILRRSGRDAIAVLNVLQTQNKNILDFAFMFDDGRILSNIERRFKSFLVTNENIGNLPRYSNVQNKKFAKLSNSLETK
ncbi:MAG: hypothetical protein Fur0010_07400 [Bdellovibrio sp.]